MSEQGQVSKRNEKEVLFSDRIACKMQILNDIICP